MDDIMTKEERERIADAMAVQFCIGNGLDPYEDVAMGGDDDGYYVPSHNTVLDMIFYGPRWTVYRGAAMRHIIMAEAYIIAMPAQL